MEIMKPSFEVKLERIDKNTATAYFYGYLDEHAKIEASAIDESITDLTFDFDQLKLVNSIGIKYWVRFVGELEKRPELYISFKNCRKQIIDCSNVVAGFKPSNAKISSFYVPIYCKNCERSIDLPRTPDNFDLEDQQLIEAISDVDCQDFPTCRKDFDVDFDKRTYLKVL